jgi:hypothetical protein
MTEKTLQSENLKNLVLTTTNAIVLQHIYYAGINTYNHQPSDIKDLSNDKKIKLALKLFII